MARALSTWKKSAQQDVSKRNLGSYETWQSYKFSVWKKIKMYLGWKSQLLVEVSTSYSGFQVHWCLQCNILTFPKDKPIKENMRLPKHRLHLCIANAGIFNSILIHHLCDNWLFRTFLVFHHNGFCLNQSDLLLCKSKSVVCDTLYY